MTEITSRVKPHLVMQDNGTAGCLNSNCDVNREQRWKQRAERLLSAWVVSLPGPNVVSKTSADKEPIKRDALQCIGICSLMHILYLSHQG